MQNEMKGVPGRITTGAAQRILDSSNSIGKSLTEGYARCREDEREHNEEAPVP